jgi:predicted nuclease of predicted toxin-antitoxin system
MTSILRFLAGENFARRIQRGLRRRLPELDLLRVQDVDLAGADDPTILAWAAGEGRVLLTHDASTMIDFAYARVGEGLAMPGVVVISQSAPLRQAIEELVLLAVCSREGEWEGTVLHLPL